jgi:hypothetical protein
VHVSPCFRDIAIGDQVIVGQCRPLSKVGTASRLATSGRTVEQARCYAYAALEDSVAYCLDSAVVVVHLNLNEEDLTILLLDGPFQRLAHCQGCCRQQEVQQVLSG